MSRGGGWTLTTLTVLLLSIVAYILAGIFSALSPRLRWVEAEKAEIELSFPISGIAIRRELALAEPKSDFPIRLSAAEAPAPGLYMPERDGFESLSPDMLPILDGATLALLLSSRPEISPGGKLITAQDWYFAAPVPELFEGKEGDMLFLDLGLGKVEARVHSIRGGCIVLAMDTALASHAHIRRAEGEIITETLSGIAIPAEALRSDSEGDFVLVLTAGRQEKKTVNIIFRGGDFCLAELDADPRGLRSGDKLISSGEDI